MEVEIERIRRSTVNSGVTAFEMDPSFFFG